MVLLKVMCNIVKHFKLIFQQLSKYHEYESDINSAEYGETW